MPSCSAEGARGRDKERGQGKGSVRGARGRGQGEWSEVGTAGGAQEKGFDAE